MYLSQSEPIRKGGEQCCMLYQVSTLYSYCHKQSHKPENMNKPIVASLRCTQQVNEVNESQPTSTYLNPAPMRGTQSVLVRSDELSNRLTR